MNKQDREFKEAEAKAKAGYAAGAANNNVKDEEPEGYQVTGEEADNQDKPSIDPQELLLEMRREFEREKAVSAEYLRRLQNLQADYDNFRKRTQREKEELAKYASEKLVEALLPVLDNLDRALEASSKTQDFASLAKGLEMIQRLLAGTLEKEGLACIECVGQEFDPALHEAVMHAESQEHDSNIIIDEFQKGYYLKDKVLRPSKVRVNK
ncbi:MAG: nucleotide exchange factor GrpE [Peptococcaceae bacterium]|nr:nucleotide exchange factor GrpE [Peptococcaceae bacterium]